MDVMELYGTPCINKVKKSNIRMKHLVLGILLLSLAMLPVVQAQQVGVPVQWTNNCFNTTDLHKSAEFYVNQTQYDLNQSIVCQYGCDVARAECFDFYGHDQSFPMPTDVFLFIEAIAIILFIFNVYRLDIDVKQTKLMDLVFNLICLALFLTLALQSVNLINPEMNEAIQIPMMVWLNYALSGVSLATFFFQIFRYFYSATKSRPKKE